MDQYRHHVSGFFAQRADAERALFRLVEKGLPRERLHVFDRDSAPPVPEPKADSNATLKGVLVDGAIGTAVGTGVGALAELALVAANVTLFVASPLIAPLAMLGWGASLGAIIGTTVGMQPGAAAEKHGPFSELVRDAISSGQAVLVAETRSEQETASAREVVKAEVGGYSDAKA